MPSTGLLMIAAAPPYRKDRRITRLLDDILAQPYSSGSLLDAIVVAGIVAGLDWHDLVLAVDEAERLTGLRIHPAPTPAS